MNNFILKIMEQGVHCRTCWPVDRFRDSWNMLKQDSESVTVQDKETFLVSVKLVFFHVRVFNYVSGLVERDKQDYHGKKTLTKLDSYLRSCCSLAGMVLHLDLLNYAEAVDRLSNCLLLPVFPYIHFTQHGAAAVSVCSIPWLQPARVDECTLQAQITVTSGHYHSPRSSKHQSNDTGNSPSNSSKFQPSNLRNWG